MAILGLLIEKPDMTVTEVAEGLKKRFAVCRFDPAIARQTLRQMEDGKRSPPRVTCSRRAPGRSRMEDRYRPAPAGVEDYKGWMYRQPAGPPSLREALYGQIELCQLEDLSEVIRIGREESKIASAMFSHAKAKLELHVQRNRRRSQGGEPSRAELLREVRAVMIHITPEYWSWRSVHFEEITRYLEDIARRAGIEFTPDPDA